jgi:hypothetical protein
VVLGLDRPARGDALSVQLVGTEISQMTVSAGKSREVIRDSRPFLSTSVDLRQSLQFVDAVHIAPGQYRAPFSFPIPPNAPPSLHTGPEPGGGWSSGRMDGMYVEYDLEARLDVPWWVDAVAQSRIPVFSTRRVLGTIAPVQTNPAPDHPGFQLSSATPTPLLPGQTWTLAYTVENPTHKSLKTLEVNVRRVVEYTVRGRSARAVGESYGAAVTLGGKDPSYTGTLPITVPNSEEATGPGTGELYRTYWLLSASLGIEWSFSVELQTPLTPA